jgi:dolichol-phosphate mannosyltransferase
VVALVMPAAVAAQPVVPISATGTSVVSTPLMSTLVAMTPVTPTSVMRTCVMYFRHVLEDKLLVYFFLPAYNEEANIGVLLTKISEAMTETGEDYVTIVVDDGSRDRTAEIVESKRESAHTYLVKHVVNRGLHESLRTGLSTFLDLAKDDDDILVTMDADNTHEPSISPEMIRLIRKGFDVVIASRYRPGSAEIGLSFGRHLMSRTVNLMLAGLFRIHGARDYTCGYRAYRRRALARAWAAFGNRFIESTTFSAMAEILLKMGKLGVRVAEVPFVLRYDQKGGASKMRILATIFDYFRMMVRVWLAPVQTGADD